MILVDSNVLLDIFTDDRTWRAWSEGALPDARTAGLVGINALIYAETALAFNRAAELDLHLEALLVTRLQLPCSAAYRAGTAFVKYRHAGGTKSSPMSDFYIGAHAEVKGMTILTRDVRRYRTYFPAVELISRGM